MLFNGVILNSIYIYTAFSCPARDCHQAYKCEGHFVDSFIMSHVEECIVACNSNDDCNWYASGAGL